MTLARHLLPVTMETGPVQVGPLTSDLLVTWGSVAEERWRKSVRPLARSISNEPLSRHFALSTIND